MVSKALERSKKTIPVNVMKKPVGDIGETCAGRVQRSVARLVVREKLVLLYGRHARVSWRTQGGWKLIYSWLRQWLSQPCEWV